ncbi:tetratricopeptide repeat protein [Muriicola sp. Z0-33]|uniref:tetratricopeptide repeat protein n=1 Tax=Muriicola sp. Z0-33 TaxID=2816957 RepID=UPI0022379142|nr:tetratricopeptide repeat protein [Muriicola sp. Z0-33]MCW5515471.1 tetratricopeptide repeat protein [Muriicola sp. Z0-33]
MRPIRHLLVILLFPFFLITMACKEKVPKPNPALAFIELQRGELLLCGSGQFGEVDFSLNCDYDVRDAFNLAVSLLHSFEYDEAEKAFVKVIDADPDCAMAYWGVAMSIYHALWSAPESKDLEKGAFVLEMAEPLSKTAKEQDYLNAIGAYYKDWKTIDHKTRAFLMEQKMEEIYQKYPDDTEAAIFYALALKSTADPGDKMHTNERKAGKILEAIFPDKPNHPGIAHYIIHNYDNPELAPMALTTARRYADIAPNSAHAQHMPSHIFTRLGLWEESIQSNIRSASAAQCYAESSGNEGHWTSEIHALDYLLYAYLQQGNTEMAKEQYNYVKGIKKVWGNNATVSYPFAAIPARMALENKDWDMAATLETPITEFDWKKFPWEKSILHFTRALGSANKGDLDTAQNELAILKTLQQELVQLEDEYKAKQVMVQLKASEAWIALAMGNREKARNLMLASAALEDTTEKHPVTPGEVVPANELLGDLLLAIDKPKEALDAYEKSLKRTPNRFNGLYGAANASIQSGDLEKAKVYFEKLLEMTANSNSDRPEVTEAKMFISKSIS